MAEHSSSLTTFRALVMLLCVVLIPFAAVCGTSFPAVMKAIQSGRLPTLADFRGTSQTANNTLSEAPPFLSGGASNVPGSGTSAGQPATSAPPFAAASPADGRRSDVVAASYETQAQPANGGTGSQSTTFPQKGNSGNDGFSAGARPGLSPVPPDAGSLVSPGRSGEPAQSRKTAPRLLADSSQVPASEPMSADARFKQIQQRLRELGATYYLLETWGDQNDAYRFYCRMAIGGNQHVTKQFNWVARDPLMAMTNVLQQVETWQKGSDSRPAH